MQFEVSVALNFVIGYLYNKLPRRRVNMLGEEIEKHLRMKFQEHWYPERPTKGSAYRSLRISKEKVDKVLINAAIDCGLDLQEILDALPNDLTIWIDPGEVSYRIGEKGPVKILYEDERRLIRKNKHDTNNKDSLNSESSSDSEDRDGSIFNKASDILIKPFNLDAQVFRPIVDDENQLSTSIGSLISLSPSSPPTVLSSVLASSTGSSSSGSSMNSSSTMNNKCSRSPNNLLLPTVSSPTITSSNNNLNTTTPTPTPPITTTNNNNGAFLNKTASTPMFISPATFAQTKFGSLKSKHASKKCQRMLPSEFSAYIKQKEQLQRNVQLQPSPPSSKNEFTPSLVDNSNHMTPNSPSHTTFLSQSSLIQHTTPSLMISPIHSQLSPTRLHPHQLTISSQNSFPMQHHPVFNANNNSYFTPHNVMPVAPASLAISPPTSSVFGAHRPFSNCSSGGGNGIFGALPRPNSLPLKNVPSPSSTGTPGTNNLFGNNSGGSQGSSFSPLILSSPSENSTKNTINNTKGQYTLTPFVLAN
ncbi:unnamed protein product [Didymodactylos carnosus]|uniref:Anti-proliferative protein domain-containing protein n=1 Tax=Didymodactylos carnosus TaxID=1234261 RepID=A0A814F7Y3_9BILA|nr:unnamed protein product [Didymodactylos carnosus]CAF0979515.1 unnamed protein product [Didymodactylos carnosus]CAF3509686.1 unnamed protein product [Didymodactylos carnosus]CAF3752075.1 unnamed protein product [Didymodactylos carnosus]